MDILIPDEWLRNFLETSANPKQIAEYLSLCGPSVDRVEKRGKTHVYSIEVTTNRVDSASVYGIAREAHAILPRFGIKTSLAKASPSLKQKFLPNVSFLDAQVDKNLCPRFTAALIKNVKIGESPSWMKERLHSVGVRPINNAVDISNYLMHELGQPLHTFDYDKIKGSKMILRSSKRREKITTLDGKTHTLLGGDIVIEDGSGRLIDLAGIMGGKNSQVDSKTKNVLLFVQTYNPVNIRRTSMSLAQRTEAADLFEKGLDPELVALGIGRAIELFEKLTGGKAQKEILDLYPNPYKPKKIKTDLEFIISRLGADIEKREISRLLSALGFDTFWKGKSLEVTIPSFRTSDMDIPEDIVEEVARIYGYHNLPSKLMQGKIPEPPQNTPFEFEKKIKQLLKGMGAIEVYTYSMVPKKFIDKNALRLKNPLGVESEYMRDTLYASVLDAAKQNSGEREPFHLFEMANVYIPRKGDLPSEKMTLAGIFSNSDYRHAKGVIELLLNELNISFEFKPVDGKYFQPSKRVEILAENKNLGVFGVLEEKDHIYYELDLEKLRGASKSVSAYKHPPKYPAQIEDITLVFPERTKVGNVISSIKSASKRIRNAELVEIYKDAHTFRLWYQDPKKTMIDKEVEEIRNKLLKEVKKKFGAILKD